MRVVTASKEMLYVISLQEKRGNLYRLIYWLCLQTDFQEHLEASPEVIYTV